MCADVDGFLKEADSQGVAKYLAEAMPLFRKVVAVIKEYRLVPCVMEVMARDLFTHEWSQKQVEESLPFFRAVFDSIEGFDERRMLSGMARSFILRFRIC